MNLKITLHNLTSFKLYKYFYAALAGAFFDFIVFALAYKYSNAIFFSNSLAFLVGTYANLIVCKFYVFRKRTISKSKFFLNFSLTFLTVIIGSFFISTFSFFFNVLILKILAYGFTFFINYLFRRFLIFV